ncbi:HD domain-containing protein [Fusibacillus kribbianus]|uniref:HD domain-containing protein n=1 Tax=Fusibacillus kribbianus TaxID=3044208 RepID=A0AAP4B8E6_9FIRM|nr:HD domain-containing protein [Ruminococcus sp. YH-rum2234]MDI9240945.1 HD domain-containing protein [Ruminococcus sp. YH-rum2234]
MEEPFDENRTKEQSGENRLEKQLRFILEADKSKQVFRQTYLSDGTRKENDAEHSWHLALMCALLSEYANEPIDVAKTMIMVLIHDLIEIDAGDTYAYDEAGNATKRERELKAADRIFKLLPDDQSAWLRGLWEEFEEAETPEARFALALDKVQPVLLNDATDGRAWKEHEVRVSQILNRNERTPAGSRVLWNHVEGLIEKNTALGRIRDDR